jgi:hypothetical protein
LLIKHFAVHDTWRWREHAACLGGADGALAVKRNAHRVHYAANEFGPNRYLQLIELNDHKRPECNVLAVDVIQNNAVTIGFSYHRSLTILEQYLGTNSNAFEAFYLHDKSVRGSNFTCQVACFDKFLEGGVIKHD